MATFELREPISESFSIVKELIGHGWAVLKSFNGAVNQRLQRLS
jgi:hypothetical protein